MSSFSWGCCSRITAGGLLIRIWYLKNEEQASHLEYYTHPIKEAHGTRGAAQAGLSQILPDYPLSKKAGVSN